MKIVCLDGVSPIEMDDEIPDTCIALGDVDDFTSELSDAEQALITSASQQRQNEFSAGRRVARAAMQGIGVTSTEVLRDDRRPVWPRGVIGSISHSRSLAAAVVSMRSRHRNLGIDLAPLSAVSEKTAPRLLSKAELDWVHEIGSGEWRTAIFSAKESIYKAVNPLVGEFLAFGDVEVAIEETTLSFSAHTTESRPSTRPVDSGRGFIHRVSGHWLTVFLVDED